MSEEVCVLKRLGEPQLQFISFWKSDLTGFGKTQTLVSSVEYRLFHRLSDLWLNGHRTGAIDRQSNQVSEDTDNLEKKSDKMIIESDASSRSFQRCGERKELSEKVNVNDEIGIIAYFL